MNASGRRPESSTGEDGESRLRSVLVLLATLSDAFGKRTVLILLWLLFVLAVLYGFLLGL